MAKSNSGLQAFQRRLAGIPRKAEAEVRKAMEKSADEIVDMMKRLVPVDKGELRDSIGWTWGEAPAGATVVASAESRDGIAITVYAGGGEAFHARFVEFGTQHMPASPFFHVSWRANRKRVLARTKRALRKAIKET